MTNNEARKLASETLKSLKFYAEEQIEKELGEKRKIRSAFQALENALVSIFSPLMSKAFEEAAIQAQQSASLFGREQASFILDLIAKQRLPGFSSIRPQFLTAAANAYLVSGDLEAARNRFQHARSLALKVNQKELASNIALDLGLIAQRKRDVTKATRWYKKAISEAQQIGNQFGEVKALNNLAVLNIETNPSYAKELLEKALASKKSMDAPTDSIARTLGNLGSAYAYLGELKQAYKLFKEAKQIFKATNNLSQLAISLMNIANEIAILKSFEKAEEFYVAGLDIANELQDIDLQCNLHRGYAMGAFNNAEYTIAQREFKARYVLVKEQEEKLQAAIALYDLALATARIGRKSQARKEVSQALDEFESISEIDWQRKCLMLLSIEIEGLDSDIGLLRIRQAVNIRGGRDPSLKISAIRALWIELINRGEFIEASDELNREIRWLRVHDPSELVERLHFASYDLVKNGRVREAIRRLRQALRVTMPQDDVRLASIRQDLAINLAEQNKFKEAETLLKQNIVVARRRDDRVLESLSLGNLGETERRQGKNEQALHHLQKAVLLSTRLNDLENIAGWQNDIALTHRDMGNHKLAGKILDSALGLARKIDAKSEEATILGSIGVIAAQSERFSEAILKYRESIEIADSIGDTLLASNMRFNMAAASYHLKNYDEALREAETVIKKTADLKLFDLMSNVAGSATVWAIECHRPARAGEYTAVAIVGRVNSEKIDLVSGFSLITIAYRSLSEKRYTQYKNALKRQLKKSDRSGSLWKYIEESEIKIRNLEDHANSNEVLKQV